MHNQCKGFQPHLGPPAKPVTQIMPSCVAWEWTIQQHGRQRGITLCVRASGQALSKEVLPPPCVFYLSHSGLIRWASLLMHLTNICLNSCVFWFPISLIACFHNLVWLTLCDMTICIHKKVIFLLNSSCRAIFMGWGEEKRNLKKKTITDTQSPDVFFTFEDNREGRSWDRTSASK